MKKKQKSNIFLKQNQTGWVIGCLFFKKMYGFSGKNQEKMRNTENVVKSKHFSQTFAGMLLKHLRGGGYNRHVF